MESLTVFARYYLVSCALTSSYINMKFILMWFALFVTVSTVEPDEHSFIIQQEKIIVLKPRGFLLLIPDTPEMKLVDFHANINKKIKRRDLGDINIRLNSPTKIWMIRDEGTKLEPGDVLHYWYFIQERTNYTRWNVSFKVE
ncbi:GNBP-like 3 [Carabus blaptoides fortunei]